MRAALLREKGALSSDESLLRFELLREDQLVGAVQGFDFVVGARYHCILLAAAMGIPVVGLAYHPKTFDLLAHVGQPTYALDIKRLSTDELIETFRRMTENEGEIRSTLRRQARLCHSRVRAQYDALFAAATHMDDR